MSDGNFNRALLPHTPYASGMKAGKQIAKMKATELYRARLAELCPQLSDEELRTEVDAFEHQLANVLL